MIFKQPRGPVAAAIVASTVALGCGGADTSAEAPAPRPIDPTLTEAIRAAAEPLSGAADDYDPFLAMTHDKRVVMLGEASHGTHDFYRARAEITKRLIVEQGLDAVVIEGEWADAEQVDRYVRGEPGAPGASGALSEFGPFPIWMWRNTVIAEFVDWLRAHNAALPPGARPVRFYGFDLYGVFPSAAAVVGYLDAIDPAAAARARARYACFAAYGEDTGAYGAAVADDPARSCADEASAEIADLQSHEAAYVGAAGAQRDAFFHALQNARVVKDGEEYYRSAYSGPTSTWNLRDQHMARTVDAILAHHEQGGERAGLAVWAHNTHVGDARATSMGEAGELDVGQLVREAHGDDAVNLGFTTYGGTVTAAFGWDLPPQTMQVRPALEGSYEDLFHRVGLPAFFLDLRDAPEGLADERLERAIGVVYRADTERISHYFEAALPEQFDAIVHIDETRAVTPLETIGATPASLTEVVAPR